MTFYQVTLQLLQGFRTTLILFFVTLVLALPLGLAVTFGSMSRFAPLRLLTRFVIWIIRGTPLMLQIFVVFYVPGLLFDMPVKSRMSAVLVAFVINYAAYFSEIYRGGIEAIPKGQYEAGQVLGMTPRQVFFKVILVQVIQRIVPPLSNEIITLVKDTSLARVIAVSELIKAAEKITAAKGLIWPLFYTGLFYLVFSGLLTLLFNWIEKKLSYFRS